MSRAVFEAFSGCFVAVGRTLIVAGALALAGCGEAAESGEPADGFDVSFAGGKADDGSGRFSGELADCASPLMRAIHDRASPYVTRGNVPPELFATEKNFGHLTMLRDGPEIFPAMGALIEAAESEIVFQTYVWERDSVAVQTIFRSLEQLSKRRSAEGATRPITARFVIDTSKIGVAGRRPSDLMSEMAKDFGALELDPSFVRYELAAFQRTTFGNQHSKMVVVDGRWAIVTGANPEIVHDPGEPWHDSGYRVDGDIALALLGDFDEARGRSKIWRCGAEGGDDCFTTPSPATYRALTADLGAESAAVCLPMLAIGRAPNANPFNNRVDNTQDQAYLAAFDHAETLIRVETPNINDDAFQDALVRAIQRGVTVELITGRQFNEKGVSMPAQGGGNEENVAALYQRLADLGIADACDRLKLRWYSYDGQNPIVGNGPRASHTKYASFDHHIAIVGSTNMDTQSWNNSRESDVVVDSPQITEAWDARLFEADFSRALTATECGGPAAP